MLRNFVKKLFHRVARAGGIIEYRGHHFLPCLLADDSVVIDLGAHKGEFSQYIFGEFGCLPFAIEASPVLFASLVQSKKMRAFNYAIAGADECVMLHLSANPEASSTTEQIASQWGVDGSIEVHGITFTTFCEQNNLLQVDLVKIDIEGSEFDMFASTSDKMLKSIIQLSVEFHDLLIGGKQATEKVWQIQSRLNKLGFDCFQMTIPSHHSVLFLNRRSARLGHKQRFCLTLIRHVFIPLKRIEALLGT
jgi:FkbM family methyltransferase